MRIFITGGHGQLGSELAEVLREEDILLAGRSEYDVTDEKIIGQICDFQPQVVIHAAAYTDVDGCELHRDHAHRVNAVGTYHVATAAEKCRSRLVYISTDYVFSGEKELPYTESDDPAPINVYGQTKWEGEQFVRQSCPRHVILRTSWVYSPYGKNFVKTILEKASGILESSVKSRKPLQVVNDQVGSPTYARDLARVISAIIEKDVYGLYHAAGQGTCTWYELACEALRLAGLRAKVVPIGSEDLDRPAQRPRNSALSQQKLNELGIFLRPWKEALAECIQRILSKQQ